MSGNALHNKLRALKEAKRTRHASIPKLADEVTLRELVRMAWHSIREVDRRLARLSHAVEEGNVCAAVVFLGAFSLPCRRCL
jgi:hypothetical protein